jgi:asparagine synthase (glutamine-hydrolysing)
VSAIIGIVGRDGGLPANAAVRRMLARMRGRGSDATKLWRGEHALLAVARHQWELAPGFSGAVLVLDDGNVHVAADAALYYREDLARRLAAAGSALTGNTPSHFIAAAYRAWGERCVEHLEGDYAFVLWDAGRQTLFCARDFAGSRPLYYAEVGASLVVASAIDGILGHLECPRDLNLTAIAASAAGLVNSPSDETCYQAISSVAAGATLVRRQTSRAAVSRFWEAPAIGQGAATEFQAAADELRHLLMESVLVRVPESDPRPSIWLSDGCDSTAIFGAGQRALEESGREQSLHPVSIGYPPGDTGREDEIIASVAEFWNTPVHWIDIRGIPMLDHPEDRAAARDEPFTHPFEMWNRALVAGSRAVGSHVALNGNGGDQLFQTTPVYLADLFRTGRWLGLTSQWRASPLRGSGASGFVRHVVQPLLPGFVRRAAAMVTGRQVWRHYLERIIPPWMEPGFVRRHGLIERARAYPARRRGESLAAYEVRWYLANPMLSRMGALVSSYGVQGGVEVRQPLLDRRIIELAASRPRWERAHDQQRRSLLRRSVQGLLPDHILCPRQYRTGTTGDAFIAGGRTHFPQLRPEITRAMALADLGIVNPGRLRAAWDEFLRDGSPELGFQLIVTLHAELWLRTRTGPPHDTASTLPNRPALLGV